MLHRSKCRENHDPLSVNIRMIVEKVRLIFLSRPVKWENHFEFIISASVLLIILTLDEEDYLEKIIASLALYDLL